MEAVSKILLFSCIEVRVQQETGWDLPEILGLLDLQFKAVMCDDCLSWAV